MVRLDKYQFDFFLYMNVSELLLFHEIALAFVLFIRSFIRFPFVLGRDFSSFDDPSPQRAWGE
jgi:hypothetical protein